MFTRRGFMKAFGGAALAGISLTGYAFGHAPRFALNVTRYAFSPPHWPSGLNLRAAVISDVHACEPWMPLSRIAEIVETANALLPDIVFLTGGSYRWNETLPNRHDSLLGLGA